MPTGPAALRLDKRFAAGPVTLGVYILHSGIYSVYHSSGIYSVYTLISYLYTYLNHFGPIRSCSFS